MANASKICAAALVICFAMCSAQSSGWAQSIEETQTLEADTPHPTTGARDLIAAISECVAATRVNGDADAANFEAIGWNRLHSGQVAFEPTTPQALGVAFERNNVLLILSEASGSKACRIVGFVANEHELDQVRSTLRSELGFSQATRASNFVRRNPTINDDILSGLFETPSTLVRVVFEREDALFGASIAVAPNM